MKIATWNINSVRQRINQALNIIEKYDIDILCLQETKVSNELFPFQPFLDKEYRYIEVNGQKQYNGVAIISKIPLKNSASMNFSNNKEKRHISVTLKNNIEIHNFYFPAGGIEPNINKNKKFAEKLNFYKEVTAWFKERKSNKKVILVGDMNIAPEPNDVWSHEKLLNIVSHTPIETEHYNALFKSSNFIDAVRYFKGDKLKIFSWWSYRSSQWQKDNKGRRLDHIWVENSLGKLIEDIKILKKLRSVKKPSDHIPIVLELNI